MTFYRFLERGEKLKKNYSKETKKGAKRYKTIELELHTN